MKCRWRLYRLNRDIAQLEKAYAGDRANAKKQNKGWGALQKIDEDEYEETKLYIHEVDQIRSRLLCAQARSLDIPVPMDDDLWYESTVIGGRALTAKGFSELRAAVRKEPNDRWTYWELRLKVIGAILTAVTGAVGALIGLAATLKK